MKWMIASLLACALLFGARGAAPQAVRTGTFDRQVIALAYYRSPLWSDMLHQKRAELKAAQQANDQKKVDELSKWFGKSQEVAHRQVFGNAPIDNIVPAIQPGIDDICKTENLAKVVPAPAPDSTLQTVDVTAQLLDWLKADEKTRDIIRPMRQK